MSLSKLSGDWAYKKPDFSKLILPNSIEEYFTKEEWTNLCEMEKMRYRAIRENYEMMKHFGLPASVPEFMLPKHARRQLRDFSESESDEDWRPRPKRKNGVKHSWCPPYRPPSATVTSATINNGHPTSPKPKRQARQKTDMTEKEEARVYCLRKRPETNYMKLEVPNDDEFVYCEECNLEYEGDCPEHGPLLVVEDTPAPLKKRGKWNRALETLPPGLEVKDSSIPNAGQGVFTTKFFPSRSRFGPYQGDIVTDPDNAHASGYCWQVYNGDAPGHFVDAQNPKTANWMRYVNCARSIAEQNVTAYQHCGEIYYRAHHDIPAGTEILVWYGSEYGKELGITREDDSRPKRRISADTSKEDETSGEDSDFTFSDINSSEIEFTDTDEDTKKKKEAQKKNTAAAEKTSSKAAPEDHHSPPNTSKLLSLERKYKCELCDSAFVQFSSLRLHMASYHGQKIQPGGDNSNRGYRGEDGKERRYVCGVCDKAFSYSGTLTIHKRIHTNDRPYKCTDCSKAFSVSSVLIRHKRIHTNDKPYKCDICDKAFSLSQHLTIHKRIHTNDKPYKCDICDKAFSLSHNLTRHKRIHTNDRPFKCDICDKAFSQSHHLTGHKRIHTNDRPFKCDICDKAFCLSHHLTEHKRIHTNDRPYKCDICDKAFSRSSHFTEHKRIHTNDKPYKCDICDKAFFQSGDLTKHKRTHSGDKPYTCPHCPAAFTQSGTLKTHIKSHE